MKDLPHKEITGPHVFTVNSIKHLRKMFNANFTKKHFQKIEEEGNFPISFYENSITLTTKNCQTLQGEKITDKYQIQKQKNA